MLQFADNKQGQSFSSKEAAALKEAAWKNAMGSAIGRLIPASEREVPREIARLDHEIDVLSRALSEHAERIGPVMTDLPARESQPGTAAPTSTSLSGSLSKFSFRVQGLRERLEALTENCQL